MSEKSINSRPTKAEGVIHPQVGSTHFLRKKQTTQKFLQKANSHTPSARPALPHADYTRAGCECPGRPPGALLGTPATAGQPTHSPAHWPNLSTTGTTGHFHRRRDEAKQTQLFLILVK